MSLFDAITQFKEDLEAGKGLAKEARIRKEEKERASEVEIEKTLRKEEARKEKSGLPEEAFTGGGMSDLAIFPGSIGNMVGQLAWDAAVANRPELAFLSLSPALLSRAGRNLGRIANVEGGVALSKRAYTKGAERAMKDPMLKDLPLKYDSPYVKHYRPGEIDRTTGKPYAHGAHYSSIGGEVLGIGENLKVPKNIASYPEPFAFRQYTLGELLGQSLYERTMPKKWYESTIRHEGRHRMQNVEGAKAGQLKNPGTTPEYTQHQMKTFVDHDLYGFKSDKYKPKNPTILDRYKSKKELDAYRALPEWRKKIITQQSEHIRYLQKPVEVEARLEEILSGTGPKVAKSDLKSAGYTDKQINSMLKEYKKYKEELYPSNPITKKAKGGYIPDSKVFSYVANV